MSNAYIARTMRKGMCAKVGKSLVFSLAHAQRIIGIVDSMHIRATYRRVDLNCTELEPLAVHSQFNVKLCIFGMLITLSLSLFQSERS